MMDRRRFLGTLKDCGLAAAIGMPLLGQKELVEGDCVDVTWAGKTVDTMCGFRLFVDLSANRLGVVFQEKDGIFVKNRDRCQVSLSKAVETIRIGARPETRLETVSPDGRLSMTGEMGGRLYVDRLRDEFGVRSPRGERLFVPLSAVVRLIDRTELPAV